MLNGFQRLLQDDLKPLWGKRVALLVNHTSIGDDYRPSFLHISNHPKVDLVRVFSPEHGLWGVAQDQVLVDHEKDQATGLPVVSLYSQNLAPARDWLADIDVLVFDIQELLVEYTCL